MKKSLREMRHYVLQEKGTEPPFTGQYWNKKDKGIYLCAGCGSKLFDSQTKFNSGTGWPSFFQPISRENIDIKLDLSHGMIRKEVLCRKCNGHLGHVFEDGPMPTGLRYCINSSALRFRK